MTSAIQTRNSSELAPAVLADVADDLKAARSENTRRAYRQGFRIWSDWAQAAGVDPIPATPESVAGFISNQARAGRKPATLNQRLCAISSAHKLAGVPDPTQNELVRETLKGIRRKYGVKQDRKKALDNMDLIKVLAHIDRDTLKGKRDAALLLLGFSAALRRSEIAALDVADIELRSGKGLVVTLAKSKTDQEGEGAEKAIPLGRGDSCPVRAYMQWIHAAGIESGQAFRSVTKGGAVGKAISGAAIAQLIKRLTKQAGLEGNYSGHSLRVGFVTSAAAADKSTAKIMEQTGHKTPAMISLYTRSNDAWEDNAAGGLL